MAGIFSIRKIAQKMWNEKSSNLHVDTREWSFLSIQGNFDFLSFLSNVLNTFHSYVLLQNILQKKVKVFWSNHTFNNKMLKFHIMALMSTAKIKHVNCLVGKHSFSLAVSIVYGQHGW